MITFDKLTQLNKGQNFTISYQVDSHPQLDYIKKGAMVAMFDGVDAIMDFMGVNMDEPLKARASSDYGGASFNTYRTYEEAFEVLRYTPEKINTFDQTELNIKDVAESGTDIDYDVVGDYIDMGRYMEGIPESMGTMHSGKSRNRRVNLTIQLNQGSWVDQLDINRRSERLLRLVDGLEHGGVRTMVTAVDSSACGHTEIILKHHAETLNISDLAVVTHSEFKRRIIFRLNEHSKTWENGYGAPRSYRDTIQANMLQGELNDEINIFIAGGMQGEENITRLFRQLEKLLEWELSKSVPEVSAIKVDDTGLFFEANGSREESEIKREGLEVIHEK